MSTTYELLAKRLVIPADSVAELAAIIDTLAAGVADPPTPPLPDLAEKAAAIAATVTSDAKLIGEFVADYCDAATSFINAWDAASNQLSAGVLVAEWGVVIAGEVAAAAAAAEKVAELCVETAAAVEKGPAVLAWGGTIAGLAYAAVRSAAAADQAADVGDRFITAIAKRITPEQDTTAEQVTISRSYAKIVAVAQTTDSARTRARAAAEHVATAVKRVSAPSRAPGENTTARSTSPAVASEGV